ncbi:glycosyltransferase [Ferdinandcohnia sp. SAFN-114]|uniref:glycosyltransferase n=1 Tax=Ferdinandcohnia sp. SAFN-114 TaxID=3387275 RepID=UPI003F7DE119
MNTKIPNLPPFLVNSIHKSGTHLLRQLLSGIPHLVYKGFIYSGINTPENHFYQIRSAGENHYMCGHIHYDKLFAQLMKNQKVKHIFLIRDPRDILVSFQYYLMKELSHTPIAQYFTKNKFNKEERLSALLQGVETDNFNYPSFYDSINYYLNWMNDPDILIIRFEDLVCSRDSQRYQLKRILKFLYENENALSEEEIQNLILLMEAANNPKKSDTFRTGKIGNWKHEFTQTTKQKFNNLARPLLEKMGYEKENSSLTFTGNEIIGIDPLFTDIKDNFTYECWIKPKKSHTFNQVNVPPETKYKSFLIAPTSCKNYANAGVGLSVATNGIIVYENSADLSYVPVLNYEKEILDWTHVALVYKNKKPELYINGEKVKEGSISRKGHVIPSGVFGGNLEGNHFKGEVRSLKVWKKSLKEEEIKKNIRRSLFEGEMDLYWGVDYYNNSTYRNGVKQETKVSVIMPNYNKYPQNLLALKSFELQNFKKDEFEVLLVDDASTDSSISILIQEKFSFPFKYIRSHTNIGRPSVRNLGIIHARGEVIVFLDAEILVKPDFIYQHYMAHQNNKSVAVSGSMILRGVYSMYYPNFSISQKRHLNNMLKLYGKDIQELCENEPNNPLQILSDKDINNQNFINLSFGKEHQRHFKKTLFNIFGNEMEKFHFPWFIFCTGNVSVKLKDLKKVGFFEEYPGYGWDDIEMGYRLHKAGIQIVNHPGLVTFHQEHPIAETNNNDADRNFYFFFKKYTEIQMRVFALVLFHITPTNVHYIYDSYLQLNKLFPNQYAEIKQSFYFMLNKVAFNNANGLPLKNLLKGSPYNEIIIKGQLKELMKIPEIYTFASNYLKLLDS